MDAKTKCEALMAQKGWTQRQLAKELGVTEQNMTHVLKGRRGLPTPAYIRLERLRGVDAESILRDLLRTAALLALAVGTYFFSVDGELAFASIAWIGAISQSTNYGGFALLVVAMLFALQARPRPPRRLAML